MKKNLIQAELAISYTLRAGVVVCASIILAGLLLGWFSSTGHKELADTISSLGTGRVLDSQILREPTHARDFIDGILALQPEILITCGILLLILLPAIRVALTVVIFTIERDYEFVAITLIVLGVLLSGLIFGKAI